MSLRDFGYAARSLRRGPGFVAVAVISLGLGLGLTTTVASLLDGILHPESPYRDGARLYRIDMSGSGASGHVAEPVMYERLADAGRSFEDLAAGSASNQMLEAGEHYQSGIVYQVTPNYFSLLGVTPTIGRTFASASLVEDENSAVVSAPLWRKLFGGQRSLKNATLTIGDRSYTIIGVMPPTVSNVTVTDVWVPLAPADIGRGRVDYVLGVGRLRGGVTADAAKAELAVLAGRLTGEYGSGATPFVYDLEPLVRTPFGIQRYHLAIAGAAIAVLLIACANLANLMLARGVSKRRELTLRMALGATRAAAVRLMVAEAALIALLGCGAGVIVTLWSASVLTAYTQAMGWALSFHLQLSWRVFAACAALGALSILVFGLIPAIQTSRLDLAEPLKDPAATTSGRSRRHYSALVVAEIAVAMLLTMAAGLLLKVAAKVARFDFGYDRRGLLATEVLWPPPGTLSSDQLAAIYDQLRERLEALPAVRSATTLGPAEPAGGLVAAEGAGAAARTMRLPSYWSVSPSVLRTFGIPVIAGRDFSDADLASGGVAVVDEIAARTLWGHASPVGRMLRLGPATSDAPTVRVVGVARKASFELPGVQVPGYSDTLVFVAGLHDHPRYLMPVVRVQGDEASAAHAIMREVEVVVPEATREAIVAQWLPFYENTTAGKWFFASLFSGLGGLGIGIAAVGIFGVLAYAIRQRRREFAIRVALGAAVPDVLRLVLHDGAVMTLAGMAIGVLLASWAGRFLGSLLYDVSPLDVPTLVTAGVVVLAVCLAACLAPALAATRADPIEILRAT
jgi:predicted permease